MKKLCLLITTSLLFFTITNGQGIYQLWGTTPLGGTDNTGTMFSTTANGNNFFQRHQFNSSNEGANPGAEPVEYGGKFYGTTSNGGSNNAGVIFEWDPTTNNYTKKIDLISSGGSNPNGSLTLNAGLFYGMTSAGGSNDAGTIFEWDPSINIYTKKIDLSIANGSKPYGSLTFNGGKFYGMTSEGGSDGLGVIFEWDPITNIFSKKIDLTTITGCSPAGGLTYLNGSFYGMTKRGGSVNLGVIFEWNPVTNLYTDRFDLDFGTGCLPLGNLTVTGTKFFGMTARFGPTMEGGTIFEWDPVTNSFTTRMGFGVGPVQNPVGSLTLCNGLYYGMIGGGQHGFTVLPGKIFAWDPSTDTWAVWHNLFKSTGQYPNGCVTLLSGKLYGITSGGGSGDSGVIFEWDPVNATYTDKINFNGNDGLSPNSSVALVNDKMYGITTTGGSDHIGVIFEWDQQSASVSQRYDFTTIMGSAASGGFVFYNGKLYGMRKTGTPPFGSSGGIYEWDPATNTYTQMVGGISGGNDLVNYSGKFYGTTQYGGANGEGSIFEWDPVLNTYTEKFDFSSGDGTSPRGNLISYNGKFYGMTQYGGANDGGVIFEWDPVLNIFSKKIDLDNTNGSNPTGSLLFSNGKFYGLTETGGSNNKGVFFEWDPSTNLYLAKFNFDAVQGANPEGSMVESDGKLYGMTNSGGTDDLGVIFEWDPIANTYLKKKDFNAMDGGNPGPFNDLTRTPAPVAEGIAGSCETFPDITIDNSNYNKWVPITDAQGNAVAEINANGNDLGIINSSAYINNTGVRETLGNDLYLDRNLTITPQFQPSSPVDIRLYIKNSEFLALKNAVSSTGLPSGISDVNDVGIYKNDQTCQSSISTAPTPVVTNAGNWQSDYVLSGTINSFSSFYFMNKALGGPLPITLLEFNGRLFNNDAAINWKTTDEYNMSSFTLERSTDERMFNQVTNVAAFNQAGNHNYNYTDKNIAFLNAAVIYYRLKQNDINNRFTYSRIVALSLTKNSVVTIYPNPVFDKANITITTNSFEKINVRLIDNAGKVLLQEIWSLAGGSSSRSLDIGNLSKGIYYVELTGNTINEKKKIIKL